MSGMTKLAEQWSHTYPEFRQPRTEVHWVAQVFRYTLLLERTLHSIHSSEKGLTFLSTPARATPKVQRYRTLLATHRLANSSKYESVQWHRKCYACCVGAVGPWSLPERHKHATICSHVFTLTLWTHTSRVTLHWFSNENDGLYTHARSNPKRQKKGWHFDGTLQQRHGPTNMAAMQISNFGKLQRSTAEAPEIYI